MAGPGTYFSGPVGSGTKRWADQNGQSNVGLAVLSQNVVLNVNGANTVSAELVLPDGAQVVDILADTLTAWNSGTSDTLSVGYTAGGADLASGVTTAAAGRVRPTFTAAQLLAMENIGANTSIYATVTPVGTAATTGQTLVTILYVQTVQELVGTD